MKPGRGPRVGWRRCIDMKVPEFVSTFEGGLDTFKEHGKLLSVFPLFDVVFMYSDNTLHHYRGVLGGWAHYRSFPCSEDEAKARIEYWVKHGKHKEIKEEPCQKKTGPQSPSITK